MALWTITRLTLLEIVRRRLLVAVLILTAVVLALTGWGFTHLNDIPCGRQACTPAEVRTAAGVILILVLYMFSFVLAVGAAFLAAPAIAGEIESGVAQAVLPRPIRRAEVVLGKWLGLVLVLLIYTALCAGMEMFFAEHGTGYLPPHPVLATIFLAGEGIVLLTLALLGSTRLSPMTVGISVLVLYGLVWLGGIASAVGEALQKPSVTHIGTVTSLLVPTDGLWRAALYNLEPLALRFVAGSSAAANPGNAPFAVSSPPTTAYVLWAICWVIVVLSAAIWSLDRRDL